MLGPEIGEARTVADSTAPHLAVGQFEQQDAIVVLLHQQTEVVVLLLESGILVGDHLFVSKGDDGFAEDILCRLSRDIDPGALVIEKGHEVGDLDFVLSNGQDRLFGEAFLHGDFLQHAVHDHDLGQLIEALLVHDESILGLALFNEALAHLFGAAVALQALFKVPLGILEGGRGFVLEALDEVPAILGLDGLGDVPICGQPEGGLLK